MNIEEKKQLKDFEKACDDMVMSNYILIDKSISQILKAVAKNMSIYNLVAECVINYNFANSFKFATSTLGEFVLPVDVDDKIAFCFCLLNALDNKTINVTKLINDYFDVDKSVGYKMFCKKVVDEFKNSMITFFKKDDDALVADKVEIEKKIVYDKKIVDRLIFLINELNIKINAEKKFKFENKMDATTICSAMLECLLKGETTGVYGLFLGLKSICSKTKNFVFELSELKNMFVVN